MENVFDDFFLAEDLNRYIKQLIKPVVHTVYNEIYTYIWFICLYNVFLIFITLANLILVYKLYLQNFKLLNQ